MTVISQHIFAQLREYKQYIRDSQARAKECRERGEDLNEEMWLDEEKYWQSCLNNVIRVATTGGLTCGER